MIARAQGSRAARDEYRILKPRAARTFQVLPNETWPKQRLRPAFESVNLYVRVG